MGNHSFNSIESKDFCNLINYLHKDASVPSAMTIKKEIINAFNNSKKKIQQVLQVNKLYLLYKIYFLLIILILYRRCLAKYLLH
jgi:hypothetical protein